MENKNVRVATLLVSYTEQDSATPLLIVAKKAAGVTPEIINAISGDEATDLYQSLITVKKER